VSVAIHKLDGVESVDVSLKKGTADIRFKPGNKISLPQLRKVIRDTGYPTKDAEVQARGQVVESNGALTFDLLNGSTLAVAARPDLRPRGPIEITGVSRDEPKGHETLTIKAVK